MDRHSRYQYRLLNVIVQQANETAATRQRLLRHVYDEGNGRNGRKWLLSCFIVVALRSIPALGSLKPTIKVVYQLSRQFVIYRSISKAYTATETWTEKTDSRILLET